MSDVPSPNSNPYSAPTSLEPTVSAAALGSHPASFTEARSLATWQLIFAVLCFLAFGIMTLYVGLISVMSFVRSNALLASSLGLMICAAALLTLVHLVLGLLVLRGSTASKRFANAPDPDNLITLMHAQLWVWRTIGSLGMIMLGAWLVGTLLAVVWG